MAGLLVLALGVIHPMAGFASLIEQVAAYPLESALVFMFVINITHMRSTRSSK